MFYDYENKGRDFLPTLQVNHQTCQKTFCKLPYIIIYPKLVRMLHKIFTFFIRSHIGVTETIFDSCYTLTLLLYVLISDTKIILYQLLGKQTTGVLRHYFTSQK